MTPLNPQDSIYLTTDLSLLTKPFILTKCLALETLPPSYWENVKKKEPSGGSTDGTD